MNLISELYLSAKQGFFNSPTVPIYYAKMNKLGKAKKSFESMQSIMTIVYGFKLATSGERMTGEYEQIMNAGIPGENLTSTKGIAKAAIDGAIHVTDQAGYEVLNIKGNIKNAEIQQVDVHKNTRAIERGRLVNKLLNGD
ncbi:MAG: hypothetical protein ACIAQZ_07680 [Sedimentisphaeraceae bacterium JB056]